MCNCEFPVVAPRKNSILKTATHIACFMCVCAIHISRMNSYYNMHRVHLVLLTIAIKISISAAAPPVEVSPQPDDARYLQASAAPVAAPRTATSTGFKWSLSTIAGIAVAVVAVVVIGCVLCCCCCACTICSCFGDMVPSLDLDL